MREIFITVVVSSVSSILLYVRFFTAAKRLEEGEIMLVTQRIEAIKAKDIAAYNVLIAEWKAFIANKKAKLELVSSELANIIKEVRAL